MELYELMLENKLTVKMIENANAKQLNYKDKKSNLSLLHCAIYSQIDPTLIKALIENKKCDLNIKNNFKSNALHIALLKNDENTVKLLINSERFNCINEFNNITKILLHCIMLYLKIVKQLSNF